MDVVNQEWLNANAGRSYPFAEGSSMLSSGDPPFRLPNQAVLDVSMAVASYDDPPDAYMSRFMLAGGVVTAVFSDARSGNVLGSASCAQSGSGSVAVDFSGVGTHDDLRGTAVFSDPAELGDRMPDGIWDFEPDATRLEARCVRPSMPCVSGLYVVDRFRTYSSKRLRGDVALIAGENVHLSYDGERNAVVISADPNYSYAEECECSTNDGRGVVRSINGVSLENVVIEGGDCIDVETRSDGRIVISDTCAKPCCGCAELAFLNEKTNELTTSLGRLEAFASTLDSKLSDFVSNALASERSSLKYV